MILKDLKAHFTTSPLTESVKFYVGIAPPKDANGNLLDLPYVVLVPTDSTPEYTTSVGTQRPTINTLNFEFHLFTRSSDALEDLIHNVVNTFDNTACCEGWMDTSRKSTRYEFDTYYASAVLSYTVVFQENQNVV